MQFKVIARRRKDSLGPDAEETHPLEVVLVRDGKEGSPTQCRDRTECLCFGNGLIYGLHEARNAARLSGVKPLADWVITSNVQLLGELA